MNPTMLPKGTHGACRTPNIAVKCFAALLKTHGLHSGEIGDGRPDAQKMLDTRAQIYSDCPTQSFLHSLSL